jgi:hypothetical protein
MKANNTGETNIKVVRKYFRHTLVFNTSKTSLKIYNSSKFIFNFLNQRSA